MKIFVDTKRLGDPYLAIPDSFVTVYRATSVRHRLVYDYDPVTTSLKAAIAQARAQADKLGQSQIVLRLLTRAKNVYESADRRGWVFHPKTNNAAEGTVVKIVNPSTSEC